MNLESSIHTIAFYNTENLFGVYRDHMSINKNFLPLTSKNWTKQRYDKKIFNLGLAISEIGFSSANKPPVLVGLAEVENDVVLQDLINSKDLSSYNYEFIHYNSLDERGIDVALLYNKDEFIIEHSKAFPVFIEEESGKRDFTRDILLVTGYLNGNKIHVLVNHWPSRHEGRIETDFKRAIAAKQLIEIISSLTIEDPNTQIIVLGDFNDNPSSESILKFKTDTDFYNTLEGIWTYSRGSLNHNFTWILFDQIFLSRNFLEEGNGQFKFLKSDIFDENFLMQHRGKFKKQPYRTFFGKKYHGGFSDHFPVYVQIENRIIK